MAIFKTKARAREKAAELASLYDIQYDPSRETFSLRAKGNPNMVGVSNDLVGVDQILPGRARRLTSKYFEEMAGVSKAIKKDEKTTTNIPIPSGDPNMEKKYMEMFDEQNKKIQTLIDKIVDLNKKYEEVPGDNGPVDNTTKKIIKLNDKEKIKAYANDFATEKIKLMHVMNKELQEYYSNSIIPKTQEDSEKLTSDYTLIENKYRKLLDDLAKNISHKYGLPYEPRHSPKINNIAKKWNPYSKELFILD